MHFFFFLMIRRPPSSQLFPHTTLFRSIRAATNAEQLAVRVDKRPSRTSAGILGFDLPENSLLITLPAQPSFRLNPFLDRKSTRLNSSHLGISYAVFCLQKKNTSNHLDS